jgi:hypothetical protein
MEKKKVTLPNRSTRAGSRRQRQVTKTKLPEDLTKLLQTDYPDRRSPPAASL